MNWVKSALEEEPDVDHLPRDVAADVEREMAWPVEAIESFWCRGSKDPGGEGGRGRLGRRGGRGGIDG